MQLSSQPSTTPAKVTFRNRTTLPLDLFFVDENGVDQYTSVIEPHTFLEISTFVHHAWRLREQFSGEENLAYVVQPGPDQDVIAERRSIRSKGATSITFQNKTTLPVDVYWLDYNSKEKYRSTIAPGGVDVQPTFVTHPWIVRDAYSHAPMALTSGPVLTPFGDSPLPLDFKISDSSLRSIRGGTPVHVTFKNLTPLPLNLSWVNGNGTEKLFSKLEPGAFLPVDTHSQSVWRIRESSSNEQVALFIASEEPAQFNEIKFDSFLGNPATTIEFRNDTLLELDLFWIDLKGRKVRFKGLSPKETYVQPTFATHQWTVSDSHSGMLLGTINASKDPAVLTLSHDRIRPAADPRPAHVTFTNRCSFAVELFQLDSAGKETSLAILDPKQQFSVSTATFQVFRYRELLLQHDAGIFITGDQPQQDATILLRTIHSRVPAQISFSNESLLTIDVIWLDQNGAEQIQKTLNPQQKATFNTSLTNPWLVRDQRTGVILQQVFGEIEPQSIVISPATLPAPRRDRQVQINFENQAPFNVDLLRIEPGGAETLAETLEPGSNTVLPSRIGQPWRMRQRASGKELAFMLAASQPVQSYGVEVTSIDTGIPTQIEFFNDTPLTVSIVRIVSLEEDVAVATLAPRQALKVETFARHSFMVRDVVSNRAIGFTLGQPNPHLFRITSNEIRALETNAEVTINLTNSSGMDLDIFTADAEAVTSKLDSIASGGTKQITVLHGKPIHFLRSGGEELVDFYIASSAQQQSYSIKNGLVQHGLRSTGALYEGEVAVFTGIDYTGDAFILHTHFRKLSEIPGLNDAIRSIKFGPNTAATLFQDPEFLGASDVVYLNVATLEGTDVGLASISSLQVFSTAPATQSLISSTATLSEEYRTNADGSLLINAGNPVSYSVYRSILQFAPEVNSMQIYAANETSVRVGKDTQTIDPVRYIKVSPDATNSVMLVIEANAIGAPCLMIHTDKMGEHERTFVFPDQDVHDKIVAMKPGELDRNRARLGIKPEFDGEACNHIQRAIQALGKTTQMVGTPGGVGQRLVLAGNMEHSAWSLDLRGNDEGIVYRPLSPEELDSATKGAVVMDGIAQGFWDDAWSAAKAAWGEVDRVVIEPAKKVGEQAISEAEKLAQQAKDEAEKLVAQAKRDIVDPVVNFVDEKIVKPVEQIAQQVGQVILEAVAIVITVGGQAVKFLLDTAEKVGAAIGAVLEQIGSGIVKAINYLSTLFDWKDYLNTHDQLLAMVNNGFDKANAVIDFLKSQAGKAVSIARSSVINALDEQIQKFGGPKPTASPSSDAKPNLGNNDQHGWLQSKISGGDSGPFDIGGSIADKALQIVEDSISTIVQHFEKEAPAILEAFEGAVESFKSAFKDTGNFINRFLVALLQLLKSIALVGFTLIETVLDVFTVIVKGIVTMVKTILNTPIEIPFVSDLYRLINNNHDLTLLSVVCLLTAIPVTLSCKLLLGKSPSAAFAALAQGAEQESAKMKAAAFVGLQYLSVPLALGAGLAGERSKKAGKFFKVALWIVSAIGVGLQYPNEFGTPGGDIDLDKAVHLATAADQFGLACAYFGTLPLLVDLVGLGIEFANRSDADKQSIGRVVNFFSMLANALVFCLTCSYVAKLSLRYNAIAAPGFDSTSFFRSSGLSSSEQHSLVEDVRGKGEAAVGLTATGNMLAATGPLALNLGSFLKETAVVKAIMIAAGLFTYGAVGTVVAGQVIADKL